MEMLDMECPQTSEAIHFEREGQGGSPLIPDVPLSFDQHTRLRIWEVEELFKCPVIGWCFDAAEQKMILRKEGISIKGKTNFQIHEIVVGSLEKENQLSRKIDFWLNRKYKKEIRELSSLDPEEFLRRWKASLKNGEVEGILWVAVTKADLSKEAKRSIFGDVHMENHARTKQIGHERQRLAQERKRNAILADSVREVSQMNKILKKENEKLRNELGIACRLSDTLQGQNRKLEKELSRVNANDYLVRLQKENAELRAGRDEMLKQISDHQIELSRLQNQNNKLVFKLDKQRQPRIHLSHESGNPANQSRSSGLHDHVSSLDLDQKCVLVVGGLPKIASLYRRLIERNGGIFEYHDGRMNMGAKELVRQALRADLILCCLDHNSHTAALVVKKLCKKYKKTFRMLMNSSLNTMFLTLLALQDRFMTVENKQKNYKDNLFQNRSREQTIQYVQP